MARHASDVQLRIIVAVEKQLRGSGEGGLTLDRIAEEAKCAKGLLTYHFKNKHQLIARAAEQLLRERNDRWQRALDTPDPKQAIDQVWQIISEESASGFWRAWWTIATSGDEMTVQTVNNATDSFSSTLATSVTKLIAGMGLVPTVEPSELGHLVSAAVQGFGMQLSTGLPANHVEGAHAALWVSILSLTRPRRR